MLDDRPGETCLDALRPQVTGNDAVLDTPFGPRPLLYADYTASGRAVDAIERVIARLLHDYANPHSEDSATGRASNAWMSDAERIIKQAVNAGPDDCLLPCGSGATGAIHKLQEILGLAIAPATRRSLGLAPDARTDTVVFIGPYEHHSNELSWRESLAETVTVPLCAQGGLDFDALERALRDPRHAGKRKIGAFSAASNVTGVKTDVRRLARLLHAHEALVCLDCAASAPYEAIDMHPQGDPQARIDAVYFSPHKFVGGPGSCGVLLFNAALYPRDLPPTQSAGGTVRYVWPGGHDFIEGIEARERAGTPGLPQFVRAALAMQLQAEIGLDRIATREQAALRQAFSRWCDHPGVEILGPADPERRLGIVAFNLRDADGAVVPPRLVTMLLSDLFGIQSRAGCSCAGPYAHHLLGLEAEETRAIRQRVLDGETGARPGWCRVSLHWLMSAEEIDYLVDAVSFLGHHARALGRHYRCEPRTGAWQHARAAASAPGFPDSLLVAADDGAPRSDDGKAAATETLRAAAFETARSLLASAPEASGVSS